MASNYLVPDVTPLAQGIGGLISQNINKRLQNKALEGDQKAFARLSSRDPRSAGAIGGILQGNQEREAAGKQKRQQVKSRIMKTLAGVGQDKLPQTLESVLPLLQSDQDLQPLIGEAQGLLSRFESEPEAVMTEIQTANAIFNTNEQLKVRKTVTYPNGAVLNVGEDGVAAVTDEQGNTFRQGESGYGQALKRGLQSEVDLAAGKAGSKVEATKGAERREEIKAQVSNTLRSAPVEIRKLERLEKVFGTANTGGEKAFLAGLGRLVPGATGAGLEDALAATNDFVLAAAGRLSGPVSEKELQFLQEVGPRIANSPEGNRRIIQRMIQAYKDDLELAKAQRKWQKEGKNPEDFDVSGFIAEKEGARDAAFSLDDLPSGQQSSAQFEGFKIISVE